MLTERPIPRTITNNRAGSSHTKDHLETTDAMDALDIHMDNLNDPETMESVANILESGVDLVSMTEAILRSAVLEGIHNVDISILIAPLLHEYIKGEADALGIKYDEGFENKEGVERVRNRAIGSKILRELNIEQKPEVPDEAPEMVEEEQPMEEEPKRGLMARTV